jgi:hypothetical protein
MRCSNKDPNVCDSSSIFNRFRPGLAAFIGGAATPLVPAFPMIQGYSPDGQQGIDQVD